MQSVIQGLWLVVFLGALPIVFAILLQFVTQHTRLHDRLAAALASVVAPYFVSLAVLFALFAAFLGNDIWGRLQSQLQRLEGSIQREASAIRLMNALATAEGAGGETVGDRVKRYARITLAEELLPFRRVQSTRARDAFQDLARSVASGNSAFAARRTVQAAMLTAVGRIEQARSERFYATGAHNHPIIWIAVIALGALSQIAMVMVHISSRSSQAAALGLFTIGFSLTLIILTVSDQQLSHPPTIAPDVFAPVVGGTSLGP